MGDALKKVQVGEKLRIPAQAFNTFVDAAKDYLQRQQSGGAASGSGGGRPASVVLVRNDTGADRGLFEIVVLDAPVYGPDDNADEYKFRFAFKARVPTVGDLGRFAVLLEPIAQGKIGRAMVQGVAPVRLFVNETGGPYADICITEGEECARLETQRRGAAFILWSETPDGEDGTGEVNAIVRISNVSPQDPAAAVHTLKVTGVYGAYNVPFNPAVHPFILYVTGYFAFADKSWVDESRVYIVKATNLPASASVGFKKIQVNDFIGYMLADGFEPVPGAQNQETYAGQVIAFPGPEGALLSTSTKIDGGPGIIVEPNADPAKDEPKVSVELADSDPGLEFDAQGDDGKLKVLPDETAGVTVTDDGVTVKLEEDGNGQKNGGLEFAQDGDIKVLPNEAEGITVKLQGVSAKLEPDHGLGFANDGDMLVMVKQAGGVDVDQDGLFAVVDPTRGIDVDANGLFAIVNEQAGMTVDADGLAVKIVNEPGGLTFDNAGNVKHNSPDPNVVTERAYFENVYGENIGKTGDGSIQFDKNGHLNALDGASIIHTGPGARLGTTGNGSSDGTSIVRTVETDANGHVRRYFRNWHAGGGVWSGVWEGPCA